ncbi:MAG: c-type cytochrome [Anaerolineales bacterium]|nr:c-type cytochrome [Anaerolineales bacterium]
MNEETKKKINAKYERELSNGERFWPDSIFKDVIVALGFFVLLLVLATFIGVHDTPKADPSDTSYVPRPEWYFLFLFKFLALYGQIPVLGKIEFIAAVIIPVIAIGVLTLLPFLEKSPYRYYGKRVLPISVMAIFVVSMVTLTWISDIPTTSGEEGLYLAGILQTIGGLVVPGLAFLLLFIMAFTMKDKAKQAMTWTAVIASVLMVAFTGGTLLAAPEIETVEEEIPVTLADRIVAGQDLYSLHCVECHGDDGSVVVIEGVEGLEGEEITPINSKDVLYTLTDSAMVEVISYGRPNYGMNPFGLAHGGELTRNQIDYMVTFMRYAWDDRFEMPPIRPLFPALAEGEVPSYDVHIAPITKRYCISCHRAGKDNNDFLMTSYEEMLTTGENADFNIIAGDMNSYLLQTIQEIPILDENGEEVIGVMPPSSVLKPNVVDVWMRWIMNGMPQTAEEAAALSPTPAPEATETP